MHLDSIQMVAGTAPEGFGHEFAPAHYIHAWLALTEPAGWTEAELARLRVHFTEHPSRTGVQD